MSSLSPHDPPRQELLVPTCLAALGLLAVYLGRGLSQALPGAVSGMDRVVSGTLFAGSFVTQLFAILGATVALRWALSLGAQTRLPPGMRAGAALVALAICLVVFFAAQPRQYALGPLVLGGLGAAAGAFLISTTVRGMLVPSTRAVSLAAGACALAALFHIAARILAHSASGVADAEQFEMARAVATVAFALEVCAAALAALLLWRNTGISARASASVMLICVPALVVGDPSHGFRLGIMRALERLTSHPDPLIPTSVYLATHLAVMVLVLVCLGTRGVNKLGVLGVAFALLGRSSPDTPAGALLLLLSALTLLTLTNDVETSRNKAPNGT